MSVLDQLESLVKEEAKADEVAFEVAPSAVILASTVEKARNGESLLLLNYPQ